MKMDVFDSQPSEELLSLLHLKGETRVIMVRMLSYFKLKLVSLYVPSVGPGSVQWSSTGKLFSASAHTHEQQIPSGVEQLWPLMTYQKGLLT